MDALLQPGALVASFLIGVVSGGGAFLIYSDGDAVAEQLRAMDSEDLIAYLAMIVILARTVMISDDQWATTVSNGNFTWLVASIILAIGGAKFGRKFQRTPNQ